MINDKGTRDKIVLHAKYAAEFASSDDPVEKSEIKIKLRQIEQELDMNANEIAHKAIKIYERTYR